MGWDFTCGATKESLVAELLQPWEDRLVGFGNRCQYKVRTLKHSLRGNCLWRIVEVTKEGKTTLVITLDLLKKSREGWGYKGMDESCGPCYYNCPLGFLKEVPCPNQYVAEWRAKVYAKTKTHKVLA